MSCRSTAISCWATTATIPPTAASIPASPRKTPSSAAAAGTAGSTRQLGFETGVGFVPEENLVGRARIIMIAWNDKASLFKPWTWVLDLRPSRFFNILK